MSTDIVLFFLGAALFAYTVTGGADFGVGIAECFATRTQRSRIQALAEKAIAPIWEANHMWIVLALVIVFVGYPRLHVVITKTLHIPLLLMVAGIVLRGTAFTFRYYDTGTDPVSDRLWTVLFRGGSLLVPFVFGHIAAALQRGRLRLDLTAGSVWDLYLAPWLGWFPLSSGLFVVCLFAWIATAFLGGEAAPQDRSIWLWRLRTWTCAMIASGAVVILLAWHESIPLFTRGVVGPWQGLCVGLASLGVGVLCSGFLFHRVWLSRICVGLVTACVWGGYVGSSYPVAIQLNASQALSFAQTQAPPSTLQALSIVLVASSVIVLPGLFWLYQIFKTPKVN